MNHQKLELTDLQKSNLIKLAKYLFGLPETLDPLACSSYDPYALTDPDPCPVETISSSEWNRRRIIKEFGDLN